MPLRAGVLTVSDGCARGEREDVSGRVLAERLEAAGYILAARATVPDEQEAIRSTLLAWRQQGCDLILTTGGTGFAPRDITPEATRPILDREAPGLAELLRWTGYQKLDRAVLSRGVAGISGRTLIVNLPGSTGGVRDGLDVLLPLLPHAIALLREEPVDHSPPTAPAGRSESPATDEESAGHAGDMHPHSPDTPPAVVTLMETNLDDLSPEFYETVGERLFAAGALDVFLTSIQMKKGRPATLLSVLAPPEKAETLAGILFTETSAFGIRYQTLQRFTLERSWTYVETAYGPIRIKVGRWRGKETSAAPEYEDVKAAAKSHDVPVKKIYIAALQAYLNAEDSNRLL